MLLRASGEHDGTAHNLREIVNPGTGDSTVADAALLLAYADAFQSGDAKALDRESGRLAAALGEEALVDAAGVVAIFSAVVRIADATGIPLEDFKAAASVDIRAELGIDAYRASGASADNPDNA